MIITTYSNRETSFAAQKGVTLKQETNTSLPGNPVTLYAKGPDHPDYFLCTVDSFGNVCDDAGIVVYPSGSGAHPLERGENGYFGHFVENYKRDRKSADGSKYADLPSVDSVTTVRAARKASGLTQQQLADAVGVNVSQIQKLESGEIKPGNMSAKNLISIADVLGVDPRDLI